MNKDYTVAARVTVEKDDLAFPGERVLVARFRLSGEAFFLAKHMSAAFPHGNIYVTDNRCGREFIYNNGETITARVVEEA